MRLLSPYALCALMFQAVLVAGCTPAQAAPEPTGLPLPRFVTLDSGEVNLRTGPGFQYPVDWVYHRAELPIEIVAEYRNWRKVRDWQGDEGWVHKNMLSGRRGIIVTGSVRSLRAEPDAASGEIARAEPGVVGKLIGCPQNGMFCRVRLDGYEGWLSRDGFWGAYPGESVR